MPAAVPRTLRYKKDGSEAKIVREDEIEGFSEPVVILGDPGLGKTTLTEALGAKPGMNYVRAGTLKRSANPHTLFGDVGRVIVDGLDEIASATQGGAVEAVLEKLSAMGHPPFVLSCREADWLGAADGIKIADDYGTVPIVLHLDPFTRDDARAFLSQEFPELDADSLLDHLAKRGIESLYENPLTLRMFGKAARSEEQLPDTRAELFDRACRVMLREPNPRHQADPHANRSEDELLLAAGAICAAQVLCDFSGVFSGPYSETPPDRLHIQDITDIRLAKGAEDALRTRLFRADGENSFTHIHRVVAEYLGAKWLARCFDDGVSERRIFALFRQGEGVPTSLRGLHAWMAHFSDAVATRCIDADPYAVLRYGDAETLSLDSARALLAALKRLSDKDPLFRSEDWGHHRVSGLMRSALKEEILAVVEPTGSDEQLTMLLLEAMAGTELAGQLAPMLDAVMLDRSRYFRERSDAWKALRGAGVRDDWKTVISRLIEMQDADSARLACDVLADIGASSVSIETTVDTILAHLGLGATHNSVSESHELRYVPDRLFDDLNAGQLAAMLDGLTECAWPLMGRAGHSVQSDVSDLVRRLVVWFLGDNGKIEPERFWSWIGWIDGHHGYRSDIKEQLTRIFRENGALRAALLEHVLLTPCADNTWLAGFRLADTQLGLYPTGADIAAALKALRTRFGDGRIDTEIWRHLLRHSRSADGIPTVVRNTAVEIAASDPELLSILDEESDTSEPDWKIEQQQRQACRKAKRQRTLQGWQEDLAARTDDIAAGDFSVLHGPAAIYLGQNTLLDGIHVTESELRPEARLTSLLGDSLGELVLAGFIAVLDRDDLPSALDIAELHCQSRHYCVEGPMICGVTEMLRRGYPIGEVARNTLAAVYMAKQRGPAWPHSRQINIVPELEAVLFQNEADWEEHFVTSIEPQLGCNLLHIQELRRLTYDTRFASLSGRLAIDWLRRFPELSRSAQQELLDCAIARAPPETARTLVIDSKKTVHPDYDTMLLWLSADFTIDFDDCRRSLGHATADNPDFLWLVRERVSGEDREGHFNRLSLAQLVFVVEAFGKNWPRTEHPMGETTGRCNPWDATKFIGSAIDAIAGRPEPEATEALHNLIAHCAPSYVNIMKHALAQQRRARCNREYSPSTICELRAVMAGGLPETIDHMRAWFEDRVETLMEQIRGGNTDMWETYWNGNQPRGENFCRNRMIEHISKHLHPSIRFEPERHMPNQRRVDIAVIRNNIGLPIEIKGQWHREVWNAACDQLDANYSHDWQAEGRGAYIVLWFGNVPRKNLPSHPNGADRPSTPEELREMLVERIPEDRRDFVDVFVVDVSKPAEQKQKSPKRASKMRKGKS